MFIYLNGCGSHSIFVFIIVTRDCIWGGGDYSSVRTFLGSSDNSSQPPSFPYVQPVVKTCLRIAGVVWMCGHWTLNKIVVPHHCSRLFNLLSSFVFFKFLSPTLFYISCSRSLTPKTTFYNHILYILWTIQYTHTIHIYWQ